MYYQFRFFHALRCAHARAQVDIPNDRRKRQRMQREAAKTYDTAHECFVEIQMNGRVAKVVPSLNARDILEVKVDNDSLTAVLDIISDELDTTEEEPPPDNTIGSTDDVPDGFSVYTNAFRCTALFSVSFKFGASANDESQCIRVLYVHALSHGRLSLSWRGCEPPPS
jgi:hypothetical protein